MAAVLRQSFQVDGLWAGLFLAQISVAIQEKAHLFPSSEANFMFFAPATEY